MLSSAQRADWDRDGFLVVPRFVDREACQRLVDRAEEIVAADDPSMVSIFSTREQTRTAGEWFLSSGGAVRCFYEEEALSPEGRLQVRGTGSVNKIGHAQHDLDPVFDRFSRTPAVAAVVAGLGFADPLLVQSMSIVKPPRIGGEVSCHQDATFLYTEPVTVTGLWFALEDATIDNGCLWAEPGGHRGPLRRRFVRAGASDADGTRFIDLDPTPLPEPGEGGTLVPLEAPAGTLVVLHGRLPHWSGPNRSDRSRNAYSVHLIERSARYPGDNWLRRPPHLPLRGF